MKQQSSIITVIILFWIFVFECFAREEKEIKQISAPPQPQQAHTPPRPILPPQVPSVPPSVSPTPSPHIAIPPIEATISIKKPAIVPNIPTLPNIPRVPEIPRPPNIPTLPHIPSQPQIGKLPTGQVQPLVPITGGSTGEVISIEYNERGTPYIEVEDSIFAGDFKFRIDPVATGMVEENKIIKLGEIGIGDTVNVLYIEQDGEKIATLIRVLSPQEIELLKQIESETIAKPEDLLQQGVPVEVEEEKEQQND